MFRARVLRFFFPAVCEPCVADVRTKAKQAALSFQNEWVTVQLVPLDELLTNKILPTRSEQVQDQAETAEVRILGFNN